MKITFVIFMLFFSFFLSVCTPDSGDTSSNFDWTYAPHFQWTSNRIDAELVCMEDALQIRIDTARAKNEEMWRTFQRPPALTDAELQETERLTALASELGLLTQIYNNPNFTGDPEQAILYWIDRGERSGQLRNVDEFNVRWKNFNPPVNMPYTRTIFPPTIYPWNFFYIGVSHTPTRAHVEFILNFFGITGESVYIVVDDPSHIVNEPVPLR